jgi:dUTP pyrophosphatase
VSDNQSCEVRIKVLDERLSRLFPLPSHQTEGSAGVDLRAMVEDEVRIDPGARLTVSSGLSIHIGNPGIAAFIFPRSGLGSRGLILANGTGIIDSDYTGPILLSLWNAGTEPMTVRPGDRVAQMVFLPVMRPRWTIVEEHGATIRGDGGFGHTGV